MAMFRGISGLALIAVAGTLMFPILTTTSLESSPVLFASTHATTVYCWPFALVVPDATTTMVATTTLATRRQGCEQPVFCGPGLKFFLIGPPQRPRKAAATYLSAPRSIRRGSAEGKRSIEERRRVHQQ